MAHDNGGEHTRLGTGVEFDLIRRFEERWGTAARGLGDDAAILRIPEQELLVVSTDASVEQVHFRRDWMSAREIGYRTAIAALSDLAAMGARPLGMTLALALPDRWVKELDDLADGIGAAARVAACPVVGGDLSRAEALHCTYTVMGSAQRPARRSAAEAGDVIYVTGALGGPARALGELSRGEQIGPALRERFVHPVARIEEGRWLVDHGARAMIDISDGLVSDAEHIAAASGVGLTIELDRLPLWPGCDAVAAARSGEEYELLLTAPASLDVAGFTRTCGIGLTAIGAVMPAAAGGQGTVTFTRGGARVDLEKGYDHFST